MPEPEFQELKKVFVQWSKSLIKMIDYTIEIGTGNLSSGTGAYSESTLALTMEVLENAKKLLLEVPDFRIFMI